VFFPRFGEIHRGPVYDRAFREVVFVLFLAIQENVNRLRAGHVQGVGFRLFLVRQAECAEIARFDRFADQI